MKRLSMYIIGMNMIALSIIFCLRCGFGVSAFSSLMYATSQLSGFTIGTTSILIYLLLVIIQIGLVRKLDKEILLQIPISFFFGLMTDLYQRLIPNFTDILYLKIILYFCALFLTALGVYLSIQSNYPLTPVDGFVKTVTKATNKPLDLIKNGFDLTNVFLTVTICIIFHSPFYGIGIGTIISAFLLGRLIKFIDLIIFHCTVSMNLKSD